MHELVHASKVQPEPVASSALTASREKKQKEEDEPSQPDSRPCSPADDNHLPEDPSTLAIARIPSYPSDNDEEVDSLYGEHVAGHEYEYGYHSSASSTQHSSDILVRDLEDEKLLRGNSRTSSHSSMSSVSSSVLECPPSGRKSLLAGSERVGSPLKAIGDRDGGFRKQRAIQMRAEDDSDNDYLTSSRRGRGQRHSDISLQSAKSPPLKRSPWYSPGGSASKQSVTREFPLVLLHCTLLPPSLPVGFTGTPNQKIVKEVLPQKHWRRWKLLEEKVGSGVLRDRGVLVSHPQDSYDLLEERLLESLELQRPRLHHGHFLGREEYDSDKDDYSSREESATDDEQGQQCPDCGGRIVTCNDQSRKWEVKVFAANGLMRAGAWAAAWKEMEKVDVEVGLWLPSDVRRELERRLLEDDENRRMQLSSEVGDSRPPLQREDTAKSSMSNLVDDSTVSPRGFSPTPATTPRHEHQSPSMQEKPTQDIDLQTLLINYICVLAGDRRNIAIALLSIVVVCLAIGSARSPAPVSEVRHFPPQGSGSVPSANLANAASPLAAISDFEFSISVPTSTADRSRVSEIEEPSMTSQVSTSEAQLTSVESVPIPTSTALPSKESFAEESAANTATPDAESEISKPNHTTATISSTSEPLESIAAEPMGTCPAAFSDQCHVDDMELTSKPNPPIESGTTEKGMGAMEAADESHELPKVYDG